MSDNIYRYIIEELRKVENINKKCKKSNLSKDTYYRILNNKSKINLKTFFKVATFLEIHPSNLLNLKKDKNTNGTTTYLINLEKLSKEFKQGMNNLKEIGYKGIESLLLDEFNISQRHFSNALAGKGISLEIFLLMCKKLKINPIETLNKVTIEEKKCQY